MAVDIMAAATDVLINMPVYVPPGGFPNVPANGVCNLAIGALVEVPGVGIVTVGPGPSLVGMPAGTTFAVWGGGMVTTYTLPDGKCVFIGWGGRNGCCVLWGSNSSPPPAEPPSNPPWWIWPALSLVTGVGFVGVISDILSGAASDSDKCNAIKNACISHITATRRWAANLKLGLNVVLRAVAAYLNYCPNMSPDCRARAIDAFNALQATIAKLDKQNQQGLDLHAAVVNVDCAPFGAMGQLVGVLGTPGPLVGQIATWTSDVNYSAELLNTWGPWLASFRADCWCDAAEDVIFRTFRPGLPQVPGHPLEQ